MNTNNSEHFTTKPFIGKRIAAALIDYIAIYGLTYVYASAFGLEDTSGGFVLSGSQILVPVILWFLLTVVTEQLLGATIGNGIVGLMPISVPDSYMINNYNGKHQRISFGQSLKRHLLDFVDISFFGIVGIIVVKSNDKSQRLGDMWAKTVVIKAVQNR